MIRKKVYIIVINSKPRFSETFVQYHLDNFPYPYILIIGRNHKELVCDIKFGFFRRKLSRLIQFSLKFKFKDRSKILAQILVGYKPIGVLAEYGHLGEYSVLISDFFKCKLVSIFRGYDVYTYHNGIKHNLGRYQEIISHNSNIIASSKEIMLELKGVGIEKNRISVIPSGVDEFFLTENLEIKNYTRKAKQILFVGRLIKDKGIYDVLKAFIKLIEIDSDYNLVIVGEGDELESIISFINSKGLSKQISIKGALPKERLKEFYLQSNYLWFMSKHGQNGGREGSPNVILEALAMGLIVIATDIGGVKGYKEVGLNFDIVTINSKTIDTFVSITNEYQYLDEKTAKQRRKNNMSLIKNNFTRRKNLVEIIRLLK